MHFIQVQNNYYTFFREKKKLMFRSLPPQLLRWGPPNIELDLMHPFLIIFLATWEGAKVQGESLFGSLGVLNCSKTQKGWVKFPNLTLKLVLIMFQSLPNQAPNIFIQNLFKTL